MEEGVEQEGQSPDESLMTKHITKRSVNKVEREERGFFVDVRSRRIHTRLARPALMSHPCRICRLSSFFPLRLTDSPFLRRRIHPLQRSAVTLQKGQFPRCRLHISKQDGASHPRFTYSVCCLRRLAKFGRRRQLPPSFSHSTRTQQSNKDNLHRVICARVDWR